MIAEKIKGQEKVESFLLAALRNGKLGSTLLFIGPEGVGKGQMALFLAKCVNCQQGEGFSCCNKCNTCLRISARNYPDVHWVCGEEGGAIKIEQVRWMESEIQMRPYEGRKKVFVIEEAQNLTPDAANALLKTLEEPPQDSLIILTSAHLDQLFSTIRSRCQKFFFLPMDPQQLQDILIKEHRVDKRLAHFAAYFSGGSIGRALAFCRQDLLRRRDEFIDNFLGSFSRNDYFDKDFFADRARLNEGLEFLINWFRDILMLKSGLDVRYLVNSDRENKLMDLQDRYSWDELQDILQAIIENRRILQQNVNPKIAFFTLRARLCPK